MMEMYTAVLVLFFASLATAGNPEDAFVDLLERDFAGDRDVNKTQDVVSFGPGTADLVLKKQTLERFHEKSSQFKEPTFIAVAKFGNVDFKQSALVMLKSPLAPKKHFELTISRVEIYKYGLEETFLSTIIERIEYSLHMVYTSNNRQVHVRVALGDEFNPRNWFTLEVKLFSLSEIEIHLDCTLLKKIKLLDPMDPMPKYLEGRLAQSIERDIFTLGWNTNNRFVGEMKKAMFVFGRRSLRLLSPCHPYPASHLEVENLENSPIDLDQTNSMSLGNHGIFDVVGCVDGRNLRHDGETWQEGACKICTCKAYDISCQRIESCKDSN